MMKMIPILAATFIPSTMLAQTHTLFIKQGTTLERAIGPHFEIPPACLSAFTTIFMLITLVIYDRLFVPLARRHTKNPRGISLLQRMGIGLVLHVVVMATAWLAERRRLSVARENGIFAKDGKVPLSIFILLFKWTTLLIPPTTLIIINIVGVVAGISGAINNGYGSWGPLFGKLFFAFWVIVHLYPFLKGLMGRQNRTPTIVVLWSILLASIFSLVWVRIDPFLPKQTGPILKQCGVDC